MKNIINMIRLRINNFIRKHKDKIKDLGQKLLMVAMGIFIAIIILSVISNFDGGMTDDDIANVYKPTQTIIKGLDVSKEQFEKDSNLVNTFLNFCNNKEVEQAYNLISDECKKEKYPTIEEFKKYYYNDIFDKKRECNLQAWISESNYIVYKVRYTNNMLATGTYDENNVYEDYITLNRKNNTEKISIGSFIDSEEYNIVTKNDLIEATVVEKKRYISDEEYTIYVKNITDKTILLDNLKSNRTIWLLGKGTQYAPYHNKLFVSNLKIEPGETQRIVMKFMKNLSSDTKSKKIQFARVIKDYAAYVENQNEYTDMTEIEIKVED